MEIHKEVSGSKERKKVFQSQTGAEIGSRLGKGSKQLNSEKKNTIKTTKHDTYTNCFSCC